MNDDSSQQSEAERGGGPAPPFRTIIDGDGQLLLCEYFLDPSLAAEAFALLRRELAFHSEHYVIYGRRVEAPRRVAWHGDADAVYTYSGLSHAPRPWTPTLLRLRRQVEAAADQTFNSVLANLYRDGNDSMGWHADKEPELGATPLIASLSLGEARVFKVRHGRRGETVALELNAGSLLIMRGPFQHHWCHSVPKTRQQKGERINLTFRHVLTGTRGLPRENAAKDD